MNAEHVWTSDFMQFMKGTSKQKHQWEMCWEVFQAIK